MRFEPSFNLTHETTLRVCSRCDGGENGADDGDLATDHLNGGADGGD